MHGCRYQTGAALGPLIKLGQDGSPADRTYNYTHADIEAYRRDTKLGSASLFLVGPELVGIPTVGSTVTNTTDMRPAKGEPLHARPVLLVLELL